MHRLDLQLDLRLPRHSPGDLSRRSPQGEAGRRVPHVRTTAEFLLPMQQAEPIIKTIWKAECAAWGIAHEER